MLDGTVDVADLVAVGLDWESHQWEEAAMAGEAEPDASTRGWVVPPGGHRVDAIFVLSTDNLGIGRHDTVHPTLWLKLAHLRTLDAIGDPVDGQIEVEIVMDDGQVIGAGWDESFCDAVVATLRDTLDRSAGVGGTGPTPSPDTPPAPAAPPAPAVPPEVTGQEAQPAAPELPDEPEPVHADLPEPASSEPAGSPFSRGPLVDPSSSDVPPAADAPSPGAAPSPGPAPGEPVAAGAPVRVRHEGSLVVEDVVYLGGQPGQTRRRKRCTLTMTEDGFELSGPGDLQVRTEWRAVNSIEVQNSDEARFRMNTKVHRGLLRSGHRV